MSDREFYCNVCERQIDSRPNYDGHIQSKAHKKKAETQTRLQAPPRSSIQLPTQQRNNDFHGLRADSLINFIRQPQHPIIQWTTIQDPVNHRDNVPSTSAADLRMTGDGWLRCNKDRIPKRRYSCDLCNKNVDSEENLAQHRGSKRCKLLMEPIIPEILSQSTNPDEVYVIRRNRPSPATSINSSPIYFSEESMQADSQFIDNEETEVENIDHIDNDKITEAEALQFIDDDDEAIENIQPIGNDEIIEELQPLKCGQCDSRFNTLDQLFMHRKGCRPDNIPNARELCVGFECETCSLTPVLTGLNGVFRRITVTPTELCISADQFINNTSDGILRVLKHLLENGENVKVSTATSVTFQKISIPDGHVTDEQTFHFQTNAAPIQTISDTKDIVDNIQSKVEKKIDHFTNKGSNWIVLSINNVTLRIVRYRLLKAGANGRFKIPAELASKTCVLNIESEENRCFIYAVVASLHYGEVDQHNRNRRAQYDQFIHQYNFANIQFPSTAEDAKCFVEQNDGVAINALMWVAGGKNKAGHVVPVWHPPHKLVINRTVATIIIVNKHWLPVTNMNRLLSTAAVNGIGQHNVYCYRCLRNLYYQNRLEKHMEKCSNRIGQYEIMPKPEEAVKKFDDWSKMLNPPFVMYADIECILQKPEEEGRILQTHVPCAVGSYLVAHKALNRIQHPVRINQGRTCIEDFCTELETLVHEIYEYNQINCKKAQVRTVETTAKFEASIECEYCKVVFSNVVQKVWHHDHISGDFIAAVCQNCNTKIRQPLATLPVFFHNLKNYDMHAMCIEGFSQMKEWILTPIAQTKEKYITLTAKTIVGEDEGGKSIFFEVRFVDSYQFLTSSLDKLSGTLTRDKMVNAQLFRSQFTGQVDDDVIFAKGVFPYSYLDHEHKLNEFDLPAEGAFYDTLTDSYNITPEDYDRATRAWQQFRCVQFRDYLHRYLELDCVLLADVFENFRVTAFENTGLDPANFITLPQFTFAAAFRNTQCDLLTDPIMYDFFEDGIRGGMSFVNTHYVKAEGDTYISYWDENNLYGNALGQLLPTSNFRWLTEQEFNVIDWSNINTEEEFGYVAKCDLEYPWNIHDETQDFPLAPETGMVTEDMFTEFMHEQWARRCEFRHGGQVKFKPEKKLLMTCTDKTEYVVHFKLLKFYLGMGMKIIRIHSVIKFTQTAIFKKYIDDNSARRQLATDDFTKDLYKLLNNSLFGKTMENVRNRKKFTLRNSEAQMLLDTSKPHYLRTVEFSEDLMLNELTNLKVKLNKPIFIGQAVLDLSKLVMYELRYTKLRHYEGLFNGKITVIGGDTDSLFCKIEKIDLFTQLHPAMIDDGLLDSSNYPRDHPLYSVRYKAKLGCIKDEVEGEKIVEAVLLKPKCYSMQTESNKCCKKRAKGIQYCVKNRIRHEMFAQVYHLQEEIVRTVRRFESNSHVVSTISQPKWALSCMDMKRAWVDVNTSLPFGHYRLAVGAIPVKRARRE